MIEFDFNWSEPFNLLLLAFTAALLPLQLGLLFRQKSNIPGQRFRIKTGLNVLLWLVVMAFIVQPYINGKAKTSVGFVAGKDLPRAVANALLDSLSKSGKVVADDPEASMPDTLILAGQDFDSALFPKIMQSQQLPGFIQWIPYFQKDLPYDLHWKGLVRNGEMQVLHGRIESTRKHFVRLKYGGQTLDSVSLNAGSNYFRLQFPGFTLGRTVVELTLNEKVADTLHYFSRSAAPMTVQFILDSPDFESRALANWLGKAGHSVIYTATLSKDIKSKLTINKGKEPDVIITDAANASNPLVKKSLLNGKSILFLNLTNPLLEVPAINAALGSSFQVRKSSSEESVAIHSGLTALPYSFVPSNRYFQVAGYPSAVQKTTGNVGVSLLNETFPLQLAGDSLAYQQIWNTLLAPIRPIPKSGIEITAPVFQGLGSEIALNNFPEAVRMLGIGTDTIFPVASALNPQSGNAIFKPAESGWLAFDDSLKTELYVENRAAQAGHYHAALVRDFVRSYPVYREKLADIMPGTAAKTNGVNRKLSDWMWFGCIMCCLLAVWMESKW
ncbi:hypothetical protein [Dyadobacter sediminis]|uniref:Uncharacterized protein n=1 Tax=Dyadobacter sediminis TaxID=1493691 RepID=A0A5R9KBE1_9BACT|nr:hypothetical protein [Dyadobacter sediminis]TLU92078.1 hypothetical protein FEM55_15115 [Dyadobacter sediminis]GGB97620.1 hypothetical protein GCM10011325_26190 [Dyadobacter sediminis]